MEDTGVCEQVKECPYCKEISLKKVDEIVDDKGIKTEIYVCTKCHAEANF